MDFLGLLNDGMRRLSVDEVTEVDVEDWLIKAVSIGDTFLKDFLCSSKHSKRVALLQKQERRNDTLSQNGDVSYDSETDDSKEEPKEASTCSFLNGEGKYSHLLTVESARIILSMYTMLHNPLIQTNNPVKPEPLLPLWILCDGTDPERTSLICCEPACTGSPMIITTVTSNDSLMSKADVPSLHEVILEGHENSSSKQIVTQAFARYEVVSQMSADTTIAETSDSSCIVVECSWNNVKKILESPRDASCKVLITAVPGDMRNTPLEVHRELNMLKSFADSLSTGEVSWVSREKTNSIQDLLRIFLDELREGPVFKRRGGDDTDDFDARLCWKTAFDRSDLDFTERLWSILRDNATCSKDISTAFDMVMTELNRGEIQPMVHSSNQTTLAKEIRTLYKDPNHIFSQDHSPMNLLVEIAIDKLQRDYTNFFLAQKLTTLHSLEWFVPSVDLLTPSDLVMRLRSLHCIIEVSMLASQSLGLPTNNILTLIRNGLEYYRHNSPDVQHTFTIPVEQTSLVNLYQNQLPSVWRLTTECGRKNEKTSSVYQLSSRPCIDIATSSTEMAMDNEGEEKDSIHYFVTRLKRDVEPFSPVHSYEINQNGHV